MENYSVSKNRVTAFIFIEDEFYSDNLHTECVTNYLKKKKLIKTDKELYSMLKNSKKEHIARQWLKEIEYHCIFGEVAVINNKLSLIVFENLTDEGISILKEEGIKKFGIEEMYMALYTGNKNAKFNFIRV